MKKNYKRRIAKEILWFVTTIMLCGLFYATIELINYWNSCALNKKIEELEVLESEIKEKDKIAKIYYKIEVIFDVPVDGYSEEGPAYSKLSQEKYSDKIYGILKDAYGDKFTHTHESFEKIKLLWEVLSKDDVYADLIGDYNTFSKKMADSTKVDMLYKTLSKDEVYADLIGDYDSFYDKLKNGEDDFWIFYWVPLDRFRIFIKDSLYVEHLYKFMTNSKKLDLVTKSQFYQSISSGLQEENQIISLLEVKKKLEFEIEGVRERLWSRGVKNEILFYGIIIIALIIYPVRLLYYAIKWAVKELKTHPNK